MGIPGREGRPVPDTGRVAAKEASHRDQSRLDTSLAAARPLRPSDGITITDGASELTLRDRWRSTQRALFRTVAPASASVM